MKFAFAGALLAAILIWMLIISRRRSIVGLKGQRKHFQGLAQSLQLEFISDGYFVQIQGKWKDLKVIILPHQFEGPGSLTLVYMETKTPWVDRNWIEPNLSIERAVVEWKRKGVFGYDVSGNQLASEKILATIKPAPYPFVAVTLPNRFIYSPLLQQTLSKWRNFVVLIALDEGRRPAVSQIANALAAAEKIGQNL
jgi:hypothetical protein